MHGDIDQGRDIGERNDMCHGTWFYILRSPWMHGLATRKSRIKVEGRMRMDLIIAVPPRLVSVFVFSNGLSFRGVCHFTFC